MSGTLRQLDVKMKWEGNLLSDSSTIPRDCTRVHDEYNGKRIADVVCERGSNSGMAWNVDDFDWSGFRFGTDGDAAGVGLHRCMGR